MTGTIPTEFGNLVGAELLWFSKLPQFLFFNIFREYTFIQKHVAYLTRYESMLYLSKKYVTGDLKLSGGIPEEISNMESLSLLILGKFCAMLSTIVVHSDYSCG